MPTYTTFAAGAIPGSSATAAITQPLPSAAPGPTTLAISNSDAALNGRLVRVIISNTCGSATSTPVLLEVTGGGCYPNCDGSSGTPLLTPNDFQCFLNAYAAGCP